MNEAKWYVVHTYSGYEKKVMQSLEAIMANREDMKDLIVDVKIPYQTVEEIKDGKVNMIEADCPDHLCMKQKAITDAGGTIVCLPNKVVIEGEKAAHSKDSSADFDAAT